MGPAAQGASGEPGVSPLPTAAPEAVRIDCGADIGPFIPRASGFLLSVSGTQPADQWIKPLRPRLWRTRVSPWDIGRNQTGLAGAKRVAAWGATIELVVSDDYMADREEHGQKPFPVDLATLDATIAGDLKQVHDAGFKAGWDIWNEPDGTWTGGLEKMLGPWLHACHTFRRLDPQATLVGPSTIDDLACKKFLEWAQANDAMPDVVSWHENGDQPQNIPAHVAAIRRLLAERKVSPRPLVCNEIVDAPHQTDPGLLVWFFAALQRADVAGACHSCWADADGKTPNGFNQSLDGILTPEGRPRAPWWIYRYYADFEGRALKLQQARTVDGVAAADWPARKLRILLGTKGREEASDVVVRLIGLPARFDPTPPKKIHVTARKIPNSGWQPVSETGAVFETDYPLSDAIKLVLPSMGTAEGYYVTVTWDAPQ